MQRREKPPRYPNIRLFCLDLDRELLRSKVKIRTENLLATGLIDEIQRLLHSGVPREAKPLQSVGYKETLAYLEGKMPLVELAPLIERETMRLAKSQRTWFRGEARVEWVKDFHAICKALMLE